MNFDTNNPLHSSFNRQKKIFCDAHIFKKSFFYQPLMPRMPSLPLVLTLFILPVLFWYVIFVLHLFIDTFYYYDTKLTFKITDPNEIIQLNF